MPHAHRFGVIASTSSMKSRDGAFAFACSKSDRMSRSDSPEVPATT